MSDQAQIEQDLAKTRARMDERLSQLQERLTPNRIVNDLMSYVQGGDTGEFASTLIASAKRNPIPAVITGIGLAWLMASDARDRGAGPSAGGVPERWSNVDEFRDHVALTEGSVTRRPDEDEATYKDRLHDAMGSALGIARSAQDTAETYASKLAESVSSTRQRLMEGAHDLRDSGATVAHGVGDSAASLQRTMTEGARQAGERAAGEVSAARGAGGDMLASVMDSPIILGALGLGIGALLGALVPQTEAEENALGGMAGQARTALRDVAQDVMDRGGAAAQQALEAGRDSAHAHGFAGEKGLGSLANDAGAGKLTGGVAEVAKDVLKAADDALHHDKSSAPLGS